MRRRIQSSANWSDYADRTILQISEVPDERVRLTRLTILKGTALIWVCLLVVRLFTLQIEEYRQWHDNGTRQHFLSFEIASERGPILDRNGELLAVSVPAGSVYVRPGKVPTAERKDLSVALAGILGVSEDSVLEKLNSRAPFVWIKRQIPKVRAEQIGALGINGVDFIMEPRRYYPYNEAGSALLGKVGIDGSGLSGVEAAYDKHLRAPDMSGRFVRDALGNKIQSVDSAEAVLEPPRGAELKVTLDAAIQLIMKEELAAAREQSNARAAMAVMVDGRSGDILAMGQSPAVNFNESETASPSELKNWVLETVYEPGSTMKPIIAAAAIEAGLAKKTDLIDCESGHFSFGRHVINDVHPFDRLTLHDVIVRSSNIGISKIGIRLGRKGVHQALEAFGFGQAINLHLPGETRGILRPVKGWAEIDIATHSYGQGVAVTPLQMVRAMSVLANGGFLPTIRLAKGAEEPALQRIISDETARTIRAMLYAVVEDKHGTGSNAAIRGVRVGGKTGTAQKKGQSSGYEAGKYIASFVGFADADSLGLDVLPVLVVLIDEPNTTSIYGGTLAAPVFQRILERTLRHLSTGTELDRYQERGDSLVDAVRPELVPAVYRF